jgi:hypothetical protein
VREKRPSAIASKLKKNLEIVPGNNQNYVKLHFLIFSAKIAHTKYYNPPAFAASVM